MNDKLGAIQSLISKFTEASLEATKYINDHSIADTTEAVSGPAGAAQDSHISEVHRVNGSLKSVIGELTVKSMEIGSQPDSPPPDSNGE